MYPDKKYMDNDNTRDLNFTPLSSEILNQIYNPSKNINFYTPVIMKEPFNTRKDLKENTESQASIRFLNSSHSKDGMDIYINSQLIKKNIKYSSMTAYIAMPAGTYTVKIYKTGTSGTPLLICNMQVEKNNYYTLAIIDNSTRLNILMLKDKNSTNSSSNKNTLVRFINLIPFSPLLNVTINEEQNLINDVEYGESTNYIELTPDVYSFEISPNDKSLKRIVVPKVALSQGTYYTIFALGRADLPGAHKVLIFKDGR